MDGIENGHKKLIIFSVEDPLSHNVSWALKTHCVSGGFYLRLVSSAFFVSLVAETCVKPGVADDDLFLAIILTPTGCDPDSHCPATCNVKTRPERSKEFNEFSFFMKHSVEACHHKSHTGWLNLIMSLFRRLHGRAVLGRLVKHSNFSSWTFLFANSATIISPNPLQSSKFDWKHTAFRAAAW